MSIKSKKLINYSHLFQQKCAGLQEDMVKRIMFSILPHLADPAQIALTEGVVDYNALRTAVEGRKKLIEYGVWAVAEEIENAKSNDDYLTIKNLLTNNQLEQAMDVAIENFQNPDLWVSGYGGKLWENIARSLRQMIRLDKTLDAIREDKENISRNRTKEVQIMRDLIVEMNVFDGLSHNSDSVMHNIIELETKKEIEQREPELNPREFSKRQTELRREKYKNIKRIMDAKELESPVEVFKLIQPTLEGSGDINQFKDWVSKMRRVKEFRNSDPDIVMKLFTIYLRKALIPARSKLNGIHDNISNMIVKWEGNKSTQDYYDIYNQLDWAVGEINIIIAELNEFIQNFIEQYPEFKSMTKDLEQSISKIYIRANVIYKTFTQQYEQLPPSIASLSQTEVDKYTSIFKTMLALMKHFSYLLDEI